MGSHLFVLRLKVGGFEQMWLANSYSPMSADGMLRANTLEDLARTRGGAQETVLT